MSDKLEIKFSTVEHWFRKGEIGFSYPSIQDWNKIKQIYNPPTELDYKMTYQESIQWMGMLPTPTAMDSTNATATMKSTQVKEGSMHSVTLTRAMAMGMLPTPIAGEWNAQTNGKTSQLSPLFVMEMMGFPIDWTLLPFLNGETNP
jgi:hypothetical protein